MIYLDHLLKATQGTLRHPGRQNQFAGFSHDSRQVGPEEIFVAVRGERGDGHDYVLDALHKGAAGMLLEAKKLNVLPEKTQATLAESGMAVVVVEDTRIALQHYARAILERWHPTVIAVSGSVGKTSTKEAIATVLSSKFATFRSWQNYNDLLGIPLSLGRLEAKHEYAVLELGCDHPGEITELCRIVNPHIGVLTNIHPVLLQYFGSFERFAEELGTLIQGIAVGGHLFYNQDDATIRTLLALNGQLARRISVHPFMPLLPHSAGSKYSSGIPQITRLSWEGIEGTLPTLVSVEQNEAQIASTHQKNIRLTSRLLGEHHFNTMLAAYQIARSRGMSVEEVTQALATVSPLPGRLNPLPGLRNTHLLDDTHNASPAALTAGLITLSALTPTTGRRIAVLGDMLSLGSYEEEAHRIIGFQAARYVDYLITRGERAAIIAEAARQTGLPAANIVITSTHEDAAQATRRILEQEGDYDIGKDVVLIKGSEETRMERVTELLMAQPWQAPEQLVRQTPGWKKTIFTRADRPTWIEVDLNAIGNNTRHIRALVGSQVRVMVSLKADAYGHGALKVARTVLHNGASMLGVATVSEAIPLREAGITAPILVYGYIPLWQMREAVRLGVTATLYDSESAQVLARAARDLEKTVKVHIKVDTGMGRLGIRADHIDDVVILAREIVDLPGLELEGIYTHFAMADSRDQTHARLQLERFSQTLQALEQEGLRPALVHAANSAATLSLPESHFDMVRPGMAIYGLDPSPDVRLPQEFRAALSFKTQVAQVKMIPEGECISYGCTYVTERPTRIAVLPVGYADGFRRTPKNWGSVLIHGQEAPILGRVCMDQCMVDVTHIPQTRVGDEVVLIGRQGDASLTAERVAERLGTINYEVVSEILARVPRVD
ncbi:MAG TPA: alanine racemase [Ktedonosporobacter sp.]|nr:alanine racemase [Ktedonosporobacter sp.]